MLTRSRLLESLAIRSVVRAECEGSAKTAHGDVMPIKQLEAMAGEADVFAGLLHVAGLAPHCVERGTLSASRTPVDAELGGELHVVAPTVDRAAHQHLVVAGAVHVRGWEIEQRDSAVERAMDCVLAIDSSQSPAP